MKHARLAVLFVAVFLSFICLSCVSAHKKDIEAMLISAMAETCKTEEIKVDYDRGIYMITPTGKLSGNGCPIAVIRGWKEGRVIKEKEVEVCECREK